MSAAAPWSVTSKIVDRTSNPNVAIVKVLVLKLRFNNQVVATLEGTLSFFGLKEIADNYNRRGVTLTEHKRPLLISATERAKPSALRLPPANAAPSFKITITNQASFDENQ